MIVKYKTIVQDGRPEDTTVEILGCEFCCERAQKAFGNGVFSLGDSDCGPTKPLFSIQHRYSSWDGMESDYYPIDFCPFCGANVTLREHQRVKRVTKSQIVTYQQNTTEEVPLD